MFNIYDLKWVLSILAIISGIFVISTKNAVISVFNLIVLYILVAFYLIYIGITYLGISYIIIYIGAIAILVRGEQLFVEILKKIDHFFCMITVTELGEKESFELNLASLIKAILKLKRLKFWRLRTVISKVKVILLEENYPLVLSYGQCHGRIGAYILLSSIIIWLDKEDKYTGNAISIHKDKSSLPKEIERINKLTVGLPKVCKNYGNRTTILLSRNQRQPNQKSFMTERGRVVAKFAFNCKYYSTGSTKSNEVKFSTENVIKKLNDLTKRSCMRSDLIIDRNLYSLVCDRKLILLAYDNIKSKPGSLTQGIIPTTLDGISNERLEKLIISLKNESFKFTPARRVYVPKSNNTKDKRPITIASPMDKLVQEAMRLILNSIYEPLFLNCSHGFRPNRSCHSALKEIKTQFQPMTWIIEGDINKCFDNINHNKLMEIIEKKIADRQFTKLIWKSLKAGYFEFQIFKHNIVGTPQGSIISPILANIYLNQLDQFVKELKEEFDIGKEPSPTNETTRLIQRMRKAKKLGDNGAVKKIWKERKACPYTNFYDPKYRRLSYVRYADDWVIGIRGSYQETEIIRSKVSQFCKSIELNVNETKTKITNLNKEKVMFLGTIIKRSCQVGYIKIQASAMKRKNRQLRFEAPIQRIRSKLISSGFIKKGKSYPRYIWMHLTHDQIIHLYNAVFRGFINYYSFVHNYSRLVSYVGYILKQSCAKLLAAKFTLNKTIKAYKKFGKDLRSPKGIKFISPKYKTTLEFKNKDFSVIQSLYSAKSIASLCGLACLNCGSTDKVEMHHIRAMKDLNPKLSYLDKLMVKANRKQIPLCKICHIQKHKEISNRNKSNHKKN